jgi:polyhydroxybutyrate depolymerase
MTSVTDRHPGPWRFARAAGAGALLLPAIWVATAGLEVARARLSHSLVSRPERLFGGDGAPWWPILGLLVCAAAVLAVLMGRAVHSRAERPRAAAAAVVLLALAGVGRIALIAFPPDPAMYAQSPLRGAGAAALLCALPAAAFLSCAAIGRRSPVLAWLSAAAGIVMIWAAVSAAAWSAMVGALQPQLWAVEPVEATAAAWCAAAGLWLLGLPEARTSRLASRLPTLPLPRLPSLTIPSPGRKGAAAIGLLAALAVAAPASGFIRATGPTLVDQLTGRTRLQTISMAGIDRSYRIYRPERPLPSPGLVIVLHGVFGSGFLAENGYHFDAQADRLGWIAVYPDGVLDGWDAFGSTDSWGRHPGADDVAFISAVIDRLEATDLVDPDRVYVTGLSRGGMMTYRLGCELSDRVAAIAPVAGNMATSTGSADVPCNLDRPVSVLAIHGTADGTIPIDGGKTDIPFSPMAAVIARWRDLDGCAGDPVVSVEGASTTTAWSCAGGSIVSTRVVAGGGHTWPVASSSSTDPDAFDAARVIADFFVAHRRLPGAA